MRLDEYIQNLTKSFEHYDVVTPINLSFLQTSLWERFPSFASKLVEFPAVPKEIVKRPDG